MKRRLVVCKSKHYFFSLLWLRGLFNVIVIIVYRNCLLSGSFLVLCFINLFSVLKLYSVSMKIHKSSCYYIWTITTSSPMISIFVESSFMADMSIVLPLFWTITRKNCLRFHYCHNAELVTFAYEFPFKGWHLQSKLKLLLIFGWSIFMNLINS